MNSYKMMCRDDDIDISKPWKKYLISQFHERDIRERAFEGLFLEYHRVILNAESTCCDNEELHRKVAKLEIENEKLLNSPGDKAEVENALHRKLNSTREELTENMRIVKEDAVRILELTKELKDAHRELDHKIAELKNEQSEVQKLQEQVERLEETVSALTRVNQLLKDEHQALQLADSIRQERLTTLQKENNDLISRWMELKLKDADLLNKENELHSKQKQLVVQRQLEEASKDFREVNMTKSWQPPLPQMVQGVPQTVAPALPPEAVHQGLPQQVYLQIAGNEGEVFALKWGTQENLLAGGNDRKIKLWRITNRGYEDWGVLTESNATVMSIDIDSEQSLLAGASTDFAARVWSIPDRRLRFTMTGHSGKVLSVKFLDSLKVVTGSHDRTLKLWDMRSRLCSKTLFAGSSCNDVVTSDGFSVISGHYDKNIRFWDTRQDRSIKEICLSGRITSLDLTKDSKYLLACVRDNTLKVLDLRMNQVVGTYSANDFCVACDWSRAVFSPDGSHIAAGSTNNCVYVWNMEGKVENVLKEHTNSVYACAWSPSGAFLASSDKSKNIFVWR